MPMQNKVANCSDLVYIFIIVLETPHVVVGAAIALKVKNPLLAIPLAFASHFVLERVPHWNPHLNTELKTYGSVTRSTTYLVVLDALLALAFGSTLALKQLPDQLSTLTTLSCCFASVLPDVIEAPYYFLKQRSELIERWIQFQKSIQADTSVFWGLATQVITVLAALWWIR